MGRQSDPGSSCDPKKKLDCRNCTIMLVRLAYRRAPWFRVIREPLWYGTRAMAAWHRVDLCDYEVRTASCYGCMRFYKVALKERSATFRWLHRYINPVFDALLHRLVTPAERKEAQAYARAAMIGDGLLDLGTAPGTGALASQGDAGRDDQLSDRDTPQSANTSIRRNQDVRGDDNG